MIESFVGYITCLLVLVITLLGVFLNKKYKDTKFKNYSAILISTIACIIINILSVSFEGYLKVTWPIYLVDLLSFYVIDIILIFFIRYLSTLIKGHKKLSKILYQIAFWSCVARMVSTTVLLFTGSLFYVDENFAYQEASLINIPYFISILSIVSCLALIIANRSSFSKRQFIVMLIYVLIPFVAIFSEYLTGVFCLLGIAITLSCLLIYILIQDTTLEKKQTKEEILEELSRTDLLTGMQNRRSYYVYVSKMVPSTKIGVIYADINGLKATNDHFGHDAGDVLISKFAKLITKSFREDTSFRIAGDEFVIILNDIKQDEFNKRFESFRELIKENNYIGAIGDSYGIAECFNKLVSEAEEKMYVDKELHGVKRS